VEQNPTWIGENKTKNTNNSKSEEVL